MLTSSSALSYPPVSSFLPVSSFYKTLLKQLYFNPYPKRWMWPKFSSAAPWSIWATFTSAAPLVIVSQLASCSNSSLFYSLTTSVCTCRFIFINVVWLLNLGILLSLFCCITTVGHFQLINSSHNFTLNGVSTVRDGIQANSTNVYTSVHNLHTLCCPVCTVKPVSELRLSKITLMNRVDQSQGSKLSRSLTHSHTGQM